jgi:hypothetical protein
MAVLSLIIALKNDLLVQNITESQVNLLAVIPLGPPQANYSKCITTFERPLPSLDSVQPVSFCLQEQNFYSQKDRTALLVNV